MKKLFAILILTALLPAAPAAAQPLPQDIITVGTGTVPAGQTIDIPVFIRDTSGTPLGMDQPPGSKIQSYSIKVNYAPAASVQSVTFSRAGITTALTHPVSMVRIAARKMLRLGSNPRT